MAGVGPTASSSTGCSIGLRWSSKACTGPIRILFLTDTEAKGERQRWEKGKGKTETQKTVGGDRGGRESKNPDFVSSEIICSEGNYSRSC